MNNRFALRSVLLASGLILAGVSSAFAQGGFGGGNPGTPGLALPAEDLYFGVVRVPPLDDLELTAVTRFEETFAAESRAVRVAEEALLAASLAVPANANDVRARVQALANAEMALALKRADGWGKLKAEIGNVTPDKMNALVAAMSSPTGTGTTGGGRGGGGGGGAPRGGAPAGRGN